MDFNRIKKYFWATAFFGWAIAIFMGSVMPTSGIEPKIGSEDGIRWDYPMHFIVFFILALLFGYWRIGLFADNRRREITWFLIAGAVYAVLTESIQLFIASRSFNPLDLIYNVLGVLTGTLLAWLFIMKPAIKREQI